MSALNPAAVMLYRPVSLLLGPGIKTGCTGMSVPLVPACLPCSEAASGTPCPGMVGFWVDSTVVTSSPLSFLIGSISYICSWPISNLPLFYISLIGPQDPSWYRILHNSTVPCLVNHALSLLFFSICRYRGCLRTLLAPSLPLYPPLACLSHSRRLGLAGFVPLGLLIWYRAGGPPLSPPCISTSPSKSRVGCPPPPASSQLDVICVSRSVCLTSCGSV